MNVETYFEIPRQFFSSSNAEHVEAFSEKLL